MNGAPGVRYEGCQMSFSPPKWVCTVAETALPCPYLAKGAALHPAVHLWDRGQVKWCSSPTREFFLTVLHPVAPSSIVWGGAHTTGPLWWTPPLPYSCPGSLHMEAVSPRAAAAFPVQRAQAGTTSLAPSVFSPPACCSSAVYASTSPLSPLALGAA